MTRGYLWLGQAITLTLMACSSASNDDNVATSRAAVVGVDTYLYFRCNATSWLPNASSRVQATAQSGIFTLSYDVTQNYMLNGSGQGDSCVFAETNQQDGWGSKQTYYSSSSTLTVPGSKTLSAGTKDPHNFQVLYPKLGRYVVRVDWPHRTFSIGEAPVASLELIHGGTGSSVHAIRQDPNPASGTNIIVLPPVTENITVSADGVSLVATRLNDPNLAETHVSVNVPSGAALLRLEYDVLDGALPYEGLWYLKHPADVSGPRTVGIQLPSGSVVNRLDWSDSDPEPLRVAFNLVDGETTQPFVVYSTPQIPDLYDHVTTPHFMVNLAAAHRRYQPAILGLLENVYVLYGQYSGQDANRIQGQGLYSYSFPPDHWKWGGSIEIPGGLSIRGLSTVNAALVPRISLPTTNGDNLMVAVSGHELGNGWWGLWQDNDPDNYTPGWINSEGHSAFLRAEGELDLGYCADANREHAGHYNDFASCTSECGGDVLLLSMRDRFGWAPFRAFYAAVQNGTFNLRGLSDVERSSVVIRFFAQQVNGNLAPLFDAAHIAMTQAVRDELAKHPSVNVPILTQLTCRNNTLRAVPNPLRSYVSDNVTQAQATAFICGPGGWSAAMSAHAGVSLTTSTTDNCGTAVVNANLSISGFENLGTLTVTASGLAASPQAIPVQFNALANALADGGFEQPIGTPWSTAAWDSSTISFALDPAIRRSGASAARIDAPVENDARFFQTFTIAPNTRYRLSGWVRTENVRLGFGAGLCIEFPGFRWQTSQAVTGTADWTYVTVEADSGQDTTFDVQARLGHYSNESLGRAWFDDLRIEVIP